MAAAGLISILPLVTACSGGVETGNAPAASGATDANGNQPSGLPSSPADAESAGASSSPSLDAPSPSPTGFIDVVASGQLTNKEICSAYKTSLVTFQNAADKRVRDADRKVKDSYDAAKFRKYNPWVKVDHEAKLRESLTALATDALNEVSNGQAGMVNDLDAYLDASIEACGLSAARSKAEASVREATSTGQSIVTKANNKPWYPKGYKEWIGDDNVAIKYTLAGGDPCGYSSCRYGKIYIVTQYGCPSGVYASANFSDSGGTVFDWDNDSLPSLGPGKRGLLEFKTYSSNRSGSYQVVEISCG